MNLPLPFSKPKIDRKNAAKLLKVHPEALEAFEREYSKASIYEEETSDNLFDKNSRMMTEELRQNSPETSQNAQILISRIVDELLIESGTKRLTDGSTTPVTNDEIKQLPEELRPQLTGSLMKKDISEPTYPVLLEIYKKFLEARNPKKASTAYNMFRQGLDIMDLDPVLYEMLSLNQNSISHWFPALKAAADLQNFFKVPETKIVKVPMTLLQLTRQDYMSLTPSTLDIVNRWAYDAFELDENKTYFIKTGTYSSKFDFRNAKVTSPQEVRELGSYLLFIHFQANQMASPLTQPSIVGVSTTNEWVVREYIPDKENNPCIYHGMPLHTEYRVFIDADTQTVMDIFPYWDPETMKHRFENSSDSESADMKHDSIIFRAHEETLMNRYNENKNLIVEKVKDLLPNLNLSGQWSLDIMQNGDDFWLIDMALAEKSAFYDKINPALKKPTKENWIPMLDIE